MSFVFDLISDFHIENNIPNSSNPYWKEGEPKLYPWHTQKQSPVLIVAGDSANNPLFTIAVITEAAQHYEHVIFVDGNHDHYIGYSRRDLTVGTNMTLLRNFANSMSNITYLNGETTARFGDTLVIGANGWYDWKANPHLTREMQHLYWKSDMNDAKCIRFDQDGFPDKLAVKQADQLITHVAQAQNDETVREIIVVTHTIPHPRGMVSTTHRWGYLNGSYHSTELPRVIQADLKKKIKVWVYGHTHFLYDFDDSGVRYVSNPRGYDGETKRSPMFTGLKQINTADTGSVFESMEKTN